MLLMITSSASKIAISSLLAILMTCTTEIVTSEKRRLCSYTSTIWTRVWLLSAPFVGATSAFGQLGNNSIIDKKLSLHLLFNFLLVPQTVLALLNILAALITSVIDTPRTIEKQETNDFYPKEIPVPEVWLSNYKQHKIPL